MTNFRLAHNTRALIYQAVMLVIIVLIALAIFHTTQQNLQRLGVQSGFDFLLRRAGFDIGQSLIPFSPDSSVARAFLVALLNTLLLAGVAIALSSLLGFFIGVARLSSNWLVARLATVYIETFRNIPVLLQIFFWYFVVLRALPRSRDSIAIFDAVFINNRGLFFPSLTFEPRAWLIGVSTLLAIALSFALARWNKARQDKTGMRTRIYLPVLLLLIGLPAATTVLSGVPFAVDVPTLGRFSYEGGMVLIPEFMALAVGLSVYNATYIAEIVRSAFQAISRGQTEAADSLGLSRAATLRLVVLPQALRIMIPPLTTVYLNLFKATSLAAAIAYPEVVSVFVGTVNNLVGRPVEIMAVTLVVYVFISLCIAMFMNWYNRRIALKS